MDIDKLVGMQPNNTIIRRPKSVNVLSYTFDIVWLPCNVEMFGAYGRVDYNSQTISIPEQQKPHSLVDALVHEILHAILWAMDHDAPKEGEEFVRPASTGLCDVLHNNPKLREWIMHNV